MKLYTAKEMAEKLKCSEQTVRKLGKDGKIGTFRVEGIRLVRFYLPEGMEV